MSHLQSVRIGRQTYKRPHRSGLFFFYCPFQGGVNVQYRLYNINLTQFFQKMLAIGASKDKKALSLAAN